MYATGFSIEQSDMQVGRAPLGHTTAQGGTQLDVIQVTPPPPPPALSILSSWFWFSLALLAAEQ